MRHLFGIVCSIALAQPALAAAQSAAAKPGETVEVSIPSRTYANGRHGWVYTPAGYPGSCRSGCNLIIVFDGAMALGAIAVPQILDSLTAAGRTPPTVAVLFDNGAPPGRIEDLGNSRRFAAFVADELLPWVRGKYVVTREADRTTLLGASAGGLGAAYIGFSYPALFGNVISLSGAFWRGVEASNDPPFEWLTQQFASSPRVAVRFILEVGLLETAGALGGAAPSLLDANRRLYAVLKERKYFVEYFEVPDGRHSTDTWRIRLPLAVVAASRR